MPLQEVMTCAAFVPPPVQAPDVHVRRRQGLASFCYIKNHMANISGFVGHMAAAAATR